MFQDLRYGVRMLVKNPGFTLVTALTLALGIGASAGAFSVVNGVLLRPLPYREPERLVRLWETNLARGGALEMTSFSNLLDWRRNRSFRDIAAWQRPGSLTLTSGTPALELKASFVTANYFSALGADAALGRVFVASEGTSARARVAVISHALWQSHFGGDPQLPGEKVQLEKEGFQIIGVMPRDFKNPAGEADIWLPLDFRSNEIDRGQTYLQALGRLKPAVTLGQAQSEMDGLAAELARQFPNSNRGRGVKLVSLTEQTVGGSRKALLIVFGAGCLALIVACSNVANLFLVRAAQRRRELSIRAALGASAGRLARQLLSEAGIVSLGGGAFGCLIAAGMLELLKALAPGQLPRLDEISLDRVALLFTLAVALLTGALLGLAPALDVRRTNLNEALKGASQTAVGGGRDRLQSLFVVSQVAAALMLLIGAGLLTNSFLRLVKANPGFHTEGVLVARMFLGDEYRENYRQVDYFRELAGRLRNLPGVTAVGAATVLPMNPFGIDFDAPYHRAEEAEPPRAAAPKAKFRSTTPDYFQAIGIPIVKGRGFLEQDRRDAPKVVIVNQILAERAWPNENPLGKQLRFFWADWQTYEVVGVAGDTKSYGLAEGWQPELFVPHAQIPYTVMNVVAHTTGDPAALADAARRAISALDPNQPPHSLTTMKSLIADSIKQERFVMIALGALSAVALTLASVGLYSVIFYVMTQRTREIGIRMALGATPRDVIKLTFGQGMALALTGMALGLCGAVALKRVLAGILYGVTATDAPTFAGVSILLLMVASLACWIPARRAAKVDPLIALRHD